MSSYKSGFVVAITAMPESELPAFIAQMDKDTRDWTMRAARGECGWICSDCCMSDQNGMPDRCFCGDERCTAIIQRDKQLAMREGNEPT